MHLITLVYLVLVIDPLTYCTKMFGQHVGMLLVRMRLSDHCRCNMMQM